MHKNGSKKNSFLGLAFDSKEFEPLLDEYKIPGGVNSEIRYLEQPDGAVLVQARYGAKKNGFSYEEAVITARYLGEYQALLEMQKIPMPPILGLAVEHDLFSDRAIIIKTSRWTGYDLAARLRRKELRENSALVTELVRKMCEPVKELCKHRHDDWEIVVGIDARCSNFTLDQDGKVWFIDLFPARFRTEKGPMVEWPEPLSEAGRVLGLFKHFDVRGIVLSIISQLSRIRPEYRVLFETEVLSAFLPSLSVEEREHLVTGIESAPWRAVRHWLQDRRSPLSRESFRELFDAPLFGLQYGVYTLREIATEFAAEHIISTDELESFFKASHFEDELLKKDMEHLYSELLRFYDRVSGV